METDIPKTLFSRAAQYIYGQKDFFKVMMGENGIPAFQQQFIQMIKKYMTDRLERFHPQPDQIGIPKEFFVAYVAYAYIGVFSYWLESDMQYSPEYVAEKLAEMTIEGPFSSVGLK